MTNKQLVAALQKAARARQRYDRFVAKATRTGKIETGRLITLAAALRDAALAIAEV